MELGNRLSPVLSEHLAILVSFPPLSQMNMKSFKKIKQLIVLACTMKNSKPAFWLFSNMELCFKKYHKLDLNNSHYSTLLIVSVFCVSVTACTKEK